MIDHSIVMKTDVFREDFLPETVIRRGRERKAIERSLYPSAWRRRPLHMWLYGESGSGKTFVCRRTLQGWAREHVVETAYINCWQSNTLYKAAEDLVEQLTILMAEPQSTSFKLERIRRHIADKPCVIVLDEIDRAFPSDRTAIIRGLCALGSVGLICISLGLEAFYALPKGVQTRLSPQMVAFQSYSVSDLGAILQDRAEAGLKAGSWTRGALQKIARLAEGDARLAIQTLRSASEIAEAEGSPIMRTPHVRAAWHSINKPPRECVLAGLTLDHRLLYQVIKEKGAVTSGELYRLYRLVCTRLARKAIAARTFSDYANRLALSGLVTSERARVRGKVRLFRIA